MQFFTEALSDTVVATTAIDAFDLVGFDDAKVAADDAPVKGIAKNPAAIGESTAVIMVGTGRVRAKGAIAKGAKVVSAATGGVKTAGATPANAFATALTAAADGEFVSILVR
ncbi:hypothetical protein ASE04_27510 [Rhizobium sp. Root708]|uniref:capsid cement protein n=1 Tax=Rhizobium sp. Root708 TaxID=1736592 RepID=UPI0006F45A6A|nr:capsid cement protein [Rhizobium sp. Root708]KRB58464.1 hypothetical protein ASE04_27510 [Rhizobium sp. Root708]